MACPRDGPGASCPAGRRSSPPRYGHRESRSGKEPPPDRISPGPVCPFGPPSAPPFRVLLKAKHAIQPPLKARGGASCPLSQYTDKLQKLFTAYRLYILKNKLYILKITVDIKYKANCISTVNYSSWTGKFPDFLLQNFHGLTQSFFSGIMPQSFCLAFQAIPVVQP